MRIAFVLTLWHNDMNRATVEPLCEGRADADGTFRIRAPAGSNYIYLRCDDGWVEATSAQDVTVADGQDVPIEFQARRSRAK